MTRFERLLLRITELALLASEREWALGDIAEEHAHLGQTRGTAAARRWLLEETAHATLDAARRTTPTFRGKHVMRNSMQDVRYAIRLLFRAPGFTLVAALTLALGIGANTAIFSVVHGVLVKPLPYHRSRRAGPYLRGSAAGYAGVPPVARDIHRIPTPVTRASPRLPRYERNDLQLGGERPEQLRGMRVTAGFFQLLGYRPQLGREFTRADEAQGSGNVAIISHALVDSGDFSRTIGLIGKTVLLSGRPFEIVGVLPRGVQHVGGTYRSYPHGESVDVWWPRDTAVYSRPARPRPALS